MDDKRYRRGFSNHQSSELEHFLNNCAKNQTTKYPRKLKAYDPWADWFNSSLANETNEENIYSSFVEQEEINEQGKEAENNKVCREEDKMVSTPVDNRNLENGDIEKEEQAEVRNDRIVEKKEVNDEVSKEVSEEVIIWRSFPLK